MEVVRCNPCCELDINVQATRLCLTCSKPMCVQCAEVHTLSFAWTDPNAMKKEDIDVHDTSALNIPGVKHTCGEYISYTVASHEARVHAIELSEMCGKVGVSIEAKTDAVKVLGSYSEAKSNTRTVTGSIARTNTTREQTTDIPAHIKEDTAMVSEDISLKKYMLQSSADTNEREEMSVRLDDIETTVNDVKLKVTDDISKVIAYCEDNITSLDIITSEVDVKRQHVKETYQRVREEALRIINESEQRAMEKVDCIMEENRTIVDHKKSELEDILETTRRINDVLRIDTEDSKKAYEVVETLKKSVLQQQSTIERLGTIGKPMPFYKSFTIVPSQTRGHFNIKLRTKHIPLILKPLPTIQSTSDEMNILVDNVRDTLRLSHSISTTVDRGMSKARANQSTIKMTGESKCLPTEQYNRSGGSSEADTEHRLGSDELVECKQVDKPIGITQIDKKEVKHGRCDGKAKLKEKNSVKDGRKEATVEFEHVLTKEVTAPDNRKPGVEDIQALSGGRIVVSDNKNSRIIFLTEVLEFEAEFGLKFQPGKLAKLDGQTLLVCLRRTNKLALISTPERRRPKMVGYVETTYQPQTVLVVDKETILVSMKDQTGDWSLIEMKKGHYSAFIETRVIQHTFRSGYNLGLLRRGSPLETWCVLQCCDETNALYCYDHEGNSVFQYCVKYPRQCVTDRHGNIYILTHAKGIHVLNDVGTLSKCFATPTLHGTSSLTINADETKLFTGKFKSASVAVYKKNTLLTAV